MCQQNPVALVPGELACRLQPAACRCPLVWDQGILATQLCAPNAIGGGGGGAAAISMDREAALGHIGGSPWVLALAGMHLVPCCLAHCSCLINVSSVVTVCCWY